MPKDGAAPEIRRFGACGSCRTITVYSYRNIKYWNTAVRNIPERHRARTITVYSYRNIKYRNAAVRNIPERRRGRPLCAYYGMYPTEYNRIPRRAGCTGTPLWK